MVRRNQVKSLIWISLLTIVVTWPSQGSDLSDYTAKANEKTSQIDRLATREVKKSLLTGTDRGGALSAFWYEGQILRLKITIGMSNRQIDENYYYENGQLIFAASKQSFFSWDQEAQRLEPGKIAMTLEDRFYFVDGKVKQWDTTRVGADLSNQNSDVAQESETLLRQSSFFIQTARDEKDSVDVEAFLKRGTP